MTRIKHLAIIGVGLIGGSLASALKQAGQCGTVTGCGRSEANLQKAVELGVIDRYSTDVATAVADADMVMVAVPLSAMADTFAAMREALRDDAVITDGGSAKGSVVVDARAHLGRHFSRFVPGHPIAGAEKSGVTAARADLYVDHRIILTPVAETERAAYEKTAAMWRVTGAQVAEMAVDTHDRILAATSHLPHMLAFSFVDMLAQLPAEDDVFAFAAGGFRDFSRIASSDTRMWHDITLANRDAILHMLGLLRDNLDNLTDAIRREDSAAIADRFARAKAARDKVFS